MDSRLPLSGMTTRLFFCHPRRSLAGIHLKGNPDGLPIITVGHDGWGDGCPMKNVGHDGWVGLVWAALGTDASPLAQDDSLAPMSTVGHDEVGGGIRVKSLGPD